MKKEEVDRLITESLSRDEAEFYRNLDKEENVFRMWRNIYRGGNGWLATLVTVWTLIAAVVAIYTAYNLFVLDSVPHLIRHGVILISALIMVSMLKSWAFQQMDKNTVLRELKRLEYQTAALMEQIHDTQPQDPDSQP